MTENTIYGTDMHSGYLNHELLSHDEETQLITRAKEGCKESRDKLITHNLKLVMSMANKHKHGNIPVEDLVQEGSIGLIIALEKFDLSLGYKFSTYATYWIKQKIYKYIQEKSRNIKIPKDINYIIQKIRKLGESVNDLKTSDLCEILGYSVHSVELALEYMEDTVSLEIPIGDENLNLSDVIEDTNADIEREVEGVMLKSDIKKVLNSLGNNEKVVLELRHGLSGRNPMTLREIGNILDVSRTMVEKYEKRAINKIRSSNSLSCIKEYTY